MFKAAQGTCMPLKIRKDEEAGAKLPQCKVDKLDKQPPRN